MTAATTKVSTLTAERCANITINGRSINRVGL